MALTTTNPNSRPIVTSETSATTGVAIAIDYTTYYERIATALETIATNSTAIKNSLAAIDTDFDTLKTQLTTIATQSTTIATQATTLATQTTTIATQQTTMATKLTALEARAADQGIHIVGPWEWLGISSIVKLYDEKGVDYNTLKTRVEQIPKSA
jgi:uncharacterized phage infection (PIP) family protein YhgE